MKIFDFQAKTRKQKGKNLDKKKVIPAVIYGKEKEPVSLTLELNKVSKLYDEAGESCLINLKIDDSEPVEVLIKDVQFHPVSGEIRHVDFYQIKRGQKIEAEVELEFVNESPAVKNLSGVLVKNLDAVDIKCLPKHLISEIIVDLSKLATFDDQIYVKDLPVPEGVEVMEDPDTLVAAVQEPRSEEELKSLDQEVKEELPEGAEEKEGEEAKEGEEKAESEAEKKEEEKK